MSIERGRELPANGIVPEDVLEHGTAFRRSFWLLLVLAAGTYALMAGIVRLMGWIGHLGGKNSGPSVLLTVDFDTAIALQGAIVTAIVFVNFFVWSWRAQDSQAARKYAFARTMSFASVMVGFASVFVTLAYLLRLAPKSLPLVEIAVSVIITAIVLAAAVATSSGLDDGSSLPRDVVRVGATAKLAELTRLRRELENSAATLRTAVRGLVESGLRVTLVAVVPAATYVAIRGSEGSFVNRLPHLIGIVVCAGVSVVLAGSVGYGLVRGRATQSYIWTVFFVGVGAALYLCYAFVVGSLAVQPDVSAWKRGVFVPAVAWMVLVPLAASWREVQHRQGGLFRGMLEKPVCHAIQDEEAKLEQVG